MGLKTLVQTQNIRATVFLLATFLLALLSTVNASCNLGSTPPICQLYICNSDCDSKQFPAGVTVYNNFEAAMSSTTAGAVVQVFLAEANIYTDILYIPDNIVGLVIEGWKGNSSAAYVRPKLAGQVSFCIKNCLAGSSPSVPGANALETEYSTLQERRESENALKQTDTVDGKLSLTLSFVNVTGTLLPELGRKIDDRLGSFYLEIHNSKVIKPFYMWFSPGSSSFDIRGSSFDSSVSFMITTLGTIESSNFNAFSIRLWNSGAEASTSVRIFNSQFLGSSLITGHGYTATIYNNQFGNPLDVRDGARVDPGECMSSLVTIVAQCSAIAYLDQNDFYSGSLQLLSGCVATGTVPFDFRARGNRFPVFKNSYNEIVPAITFNPLSDSNVGSFASSAILDAAGNWWGDKSGPWVCCNPLGRGSYATTLIDTSNWCLNPSCTSTATEPMDDNCKNRSCPLKLSRGLTGVFAAVFGISAIVMILINVSSLVQIKRTFSTQSYQSMPVVDLLEEACVVQLRSCITALACAGAYIGVAFILLQGNSQSKPVPRQQRLSEQGTTLLTLFIINGGLHILFCLVFIAALLMRHKRPGFLHAVSNKIHILNILTMAEVLPVTIVVAAFLFPKESWLGSIYAALCGNTTNVPGRSAILCILPVILILFVGITLAIPNHTLNNLLYHHDYMRINSSIEETLLKELLNSPKTKKMTLRVRIVASITIVATVAWVLCQVVGQLTASSTSTHMAPVPIPGESPEPAPNSPAVVVSSRPSPIQMALSATRMAVSVTFGSGAALILAAILWLSFSYRRPGVITFLACCLAICGFVCITNAIVVIVALVQPYEPTRAAIRKMATFELPSSFVFLLSVIVCLAFLALLRKHVLKRIPQLAVDNLNGYLDEAWHTRHTIQTDNVGLLAASEDSASY